MDCRITGLKPGVNEKGLLRQSPAEHLDFATVLKSSELQQGLTGDTEGGHRIVAP